MAIIRPKTPVSPCCVPCTPSYRAGGALVPSEEEAHDPATP